MLWRVEEMGARKGCSGVVGEVVTDSCIKGCSGVEGVGVME